MFKHDQEKIFKVEYINNVFYDLVDRLLIDKSDYIGGKPSIEEMSHIRFLTLYRDSQVSSDEIESTRTHSLYEIL